MDFLGKFVCFLIIINSHFTVCGDSNSDVVLSCIVTEHLWFYNDFVYLYSKLCYLIKMINLIQFFVMGFLV